VGAALPARIREALAALRSTRRRIVEDGRDGFVAKFRAETIDAAGDPWDLTGYAVMPNNLIRGRLVRMELPK